ncbi:MAG: UvrD-helicase domain-containing protein, partial [Gemmatimonadetes bacterium]|nr:UvrD-helicase domain-containing protein [Gemmatimonadota bacterium]
MQRTGDGAVGARRAAAPGEVAGAHAAAEPRGGAGAGGAGNAARPEPNDRQWEAIRAVDRHVLVHAGAGTGKTFTVVRRILYLLGVEVRGERIAQPVGLGRIAAITYTNRAAADLKGKLRAALRAEGLRREAYEVDLARIGTIHSFCGEVLRDFALRAGRPPAGTVLE